MKFRLHGYEIDTQVEKDHIELGAKLFFLVQNYFPEINVKNVVYKFDVEKNIATIAFIRDSKHYLDSGWVKEDDCQLITSLGQDFFYPKAFGGKDTGYFGLIAYAGSWYAMDDKVKQYFMTYLAIYDVKDVRLTETDRYLEIEVLGA